MMFFPPIPLIRRNTILRKLQQAGAFSEKNAKTLEEIGLIHPYSFPMITERMVKKGMISRTEEGKYYINSK